MIQFKVLYGFYVSGYI